MSSSYKIKIILRKDKFKLPKNNLPKDYSHYNCKLFSIEKENRYMQGNSNNTTSLAKKSNLRITRYICISKNCPIPSNNLKSSKI